MTNSLNKAFTGKIGLSLIVIATSSIPFTREKELSNLCREHYTMIKGQSNCSSKKKIAKISLIAKNRS